MKKKIYKALSLLLTFLIVFSAFASVLGTVSAEGQEKSYYVRATGDDSKKGNSMSNSVKTIGKVIELANAAGLGNGDIVNIKTVGEDAINWLATGNQLPAHNFKLAITSNSSNAVGTVGNGTAVILGGDIEFKNIKVNFGSSFANLSANGHNVIFAAAAQIVGVEGQYGFNMGNSDVASTYNESVSVETNLPIKNFGFGNINGNVVYNNKVNIAYIASAGTPVFSMSAADGTTTFNAIANLEIISATSFTFANADKVVFGVDGGLQIFNTTTKEIAATDLTGIDAAKLWVINNKLGVSSMIAATDVKGKFAVDTVNFFNVKAVDPTNENNVVEPVDGFLTLPAGVWNLFAEKVPQKGTYYIQAGGSGDGTSEESPLPSLATAVAKALADGYIAGDEVTIKAIGTEKVPIGITVPEHAFKLIVTSNTGKEATVGEGQGAILGGDTEFKNITVYFGGDTADTKYRNFTCCGHNVTFGDGCTYGGNPHESTFIIGTSRHSTVFTKDFTIHSKIDIRNFYLSADWDNPVYDCNVNVIYEYDGRSPYFRLGTGNGKSTYNKALNLNVKAAGVVSFRDPTGIQFGDEGYFQIINSGASKIIPKDAGLTSVPAEKLWVLNNISGKKDVLSTTDAKGVFAVKLDSAEHKVVATNAETNESIIYDGVNGVEGTITLPAGTYTISIDREPEYKYYYVNSDTGVEIVAGTRPEGAGTKDNPVKTYADATRLIASDGLAEIDVATIYLQSGVKSLWGSSVASVKPTIIVEALATEQAQLVCEAGNAVLSSDTVLKNVSLELAGQWAEFIINEYNLTIEADSVVTAPKTYLWNTASGKKRVDDMTIICRGKLMSKALYYYASYHSHTSTANLNIIWDNPNCALGINFGNEGTSRDANTPNIYEGNVNITIKQAEAFAMDIVGSGAELKGTLNVIIDDEVKLPYNTKVNFKNFDVAGGKWYITNVAKDMDFVSFTAEKGKFAIKNGATAYTREGDKAVQKHEGGIVDLSAAPGEYVLSDKKDITPIVDNPEKMLYYKLGGGHKHIAQWAELYDNVTYVYEYTIFSQSYNLTAPIVYEDQRHAVTVPEVISDDVIGKAGTPGANFHRVIAEFTIPEGVNEAEGIKLFVGSKISPHDEGLILDRTVYRKDDPAKTDLFVDGNNFHNGLDGITLNYEFWGKTFSGDRGGVGKTEWTNGYQELKVMDEDLSYADYLLYLNNPQDGEWWDKDDIIQEEAFATYAKAKGTFKDQNGKGIKGVEFLLTSDEGSYKAKTNAKGEFDFGVILTGFYDLYVLDGNEDIHTGFTSYISQDDVVVFSIVSDTSGIVVEDTVDPGDNSGDDYYGDDYTNDYTGEDTQTNTDGDNVEEIIPSGNLKGTVYTPNLEIVKDLKVGLRGVGEAVTDANGSFGFADIPVGDYELYAINSDGSEFVFRTITIKENISLDVKLKYDPPIETNADETDNGWIIWVIVASVVALVVVGVLIFFLVIKKKKN